MKDYIEERAVEIAYYIIENKATVRQTAKKFGMSKSTIHKDVTERLLQINPALAGEARKVLDQNKSGKAYPWWTCYEREVSSSTYAKTALSGVKILLKISDLCIQRDFES